MKNFLTFQTESYVGAIFIVLFSSFLLGLFFLALHGFNSDLDIAGDNQTRVLHISDTQRQLMDDWVRENNIQVPPGEGYRYLLKTYPSKPWLY